MLTIFGFYSENIFWKEVLYKNPSILNHFVTVYKLCYSEDNISKQRVQPFKSLPYTGFVDNTL